VVGGRWPPADDPAREVAPLPLGPPRSGAVEPAGPAPELLERRADLAEGVEPDEVVTPGSLRTHATVSTRTRARTGEALPGRSRRVVAAAGVVVLAVVGAAVALDDGPAGSGRERPVTGTTNVPVTDDAGTAGARSDDAATEGAGSADPLVVDENDLGANEAFARAAHTLTEAGSFAYRGEVRADAPGARPGPRIAGNVAIHGVVALPARARETAVRGGTVAAVETLVSGWGVWVRRADASAALADADWELHSEPAGPGGLTALPEWLTATVSRSVGPVDRQGRRTFTSALPPGMAAELVAGERNADAVAQVTLAIDSTGEPVRVEVAAAAGASRFALRVDIDGLGEPVDIAPPGGVEVGITPLYTTEQVIAGGVAAPVQLRELPTGWALAHTELTPPNEQRPCGELTLVYWDIGSLDEGVTLTIADAGCPRPQALFDTRPPAPGAERLTGPWRIVGATDNHTGLSAVSVSDGVTQVDAISPRPLADVRAMLESLGPYDRLDQPSLVLAP
jgi:hypothetical protein